MPPIVYCRPLPPYCCYVRSSYICIRKKLPFPLQKYTEIFSSPEFSRRTYMPCRWTPIRRNYVKLHLEKKSSKKKSAWWKRTLLSADVWKKKKVLNVKFFLTCSRATSSEEQICLKTKILIEVYGKKKKTTMKETTNNIHLLLLLTHLNKIYFFVKSIFHENFYTILGKK